MYPEMFEQVLTDYKEVVESVKIGNYQEKKELLSVYSSLLSSFSLLNELKLEGDLDRSNKKEVLLTITPEIKEVVNPVIKPTATQLPKYRIDRKLKGGYIEEIDAFVPETAIRNLGIEHGDLLYAEKKSFGAGYYYSIAEKVGNQAPDRIEVRNALVEEAVGRLYVSKYTTGELIKVDGLPVMLYIQDTDATALGINSGDNVDMAYYRNNTSGARVTWKTLTENAIIPPYTQETDTAGTIEYVLVVGDPSYERAYRKRLLHSGIDMQIVNGEIAAPSLEEIEKASVVVIVMSKCLNEVAWQTRRLAKEANVMTTMALSPNPDDIMEQIVGSKKATA
ncbi:hypothetical protein [Psychrobacillus sp. FSL K6-1464]|uniref:hypothetical protein n=1 Tax=Psychrobacillus sp. FSL K6-1464 TaxID=2921545 RepID=UPI0030FC3287